HLRTIRRVSLVLPLVLPLAGLAVCGYSDAGSSTTAMAGTKDSSAAKAAWRSYFGPQVQRELREMVRYQLTMDKVERFARASDNLIALTASSSYPAHIAVPTPQDLEQYGGLMGYAAAEYEWDPQQRHAIERAGLKAWEYVTIMFVLANTHDQYVRFAGGLTTNSSPFVSPENLAFYATRHVEVERLVPNLWAPSGTSAGEVK
ncbi:MAG: hypothetical protein ABJD07_05680, partial [Gemmatimonadaceae bacterium]